METHKWQVHLKTVAQTKSCFISVSLEHGGAASGSDHTVTTHLLAAVITCSYSHMHNC